MIKFFIALVLAITAPLWVPLLWGIFITAFSFIVLAIGWFFGMRLKIKKDGKVIGLLRWFTFTKV